ncbi:hypothetical protein PAPHI01_1130 [Pancytospora philotis]|nr:hypothetical protein PAPHI01_1130 [Pancytospora philotis]
MFHRNDLERGDPMGVEDQENYRRALEAAVGLRSRYQPKMGRATPAELPKLIHGLNLFSSWQCKHAQLHNSILYGFFFTRSEDWLKKRRCVFDQCSRIKHMMPQHLEDARKFSPLAMTLEDITAPMLLLGPALDDDAMTKIKELYDLEQARLREMLEQSRISALSDGEILASFLDRKQLEKSLMVYRIAEPAIPYGTAFVQPHAGVAIEPQELLRRMRVDFTGISVSIRMIRDTLWAASFGLKRPTADAIKIALGELIRSHDVVAVHLYCNQHYMCLSDKIPEELQEDSSSSLLRYYVKLRQNFARRCIRPFTVKEFKCVLNRNMDRRWRAMHQDRQVRETLQALVALSLLSVEDPDAKEEVYYFT